MKKLLLALLLFMPATACAGASVQNACKVFYGELKPVPHYELSVNTGLLRSLSGGKKYRGCEVIFKSNEQLMTGSELPSFESPEGSVFYRAGWRIDEKYRADGAGSGSYGIVKEAVLCLIHWDQDSWVNETGEIEQSELINMTVQCMSLDAEGRKITGSATSYPQLQFSVSHLL
jgi:hypothetical protein